MSARAHAAAGIAAPITVRQAMEEYLADLQHRGKPSRDGEIHAEAFIYPALGEIECSKLRTDAIKQWHRKLALAPPRVRTAKGAKQQYRDIDKGDPEAARKRRVSPNHSLKFLRAALNLGWRNGKIAGDEQWRKVKKFTNVDLPRVRYLEADEARRLVNACDPDFRDLVHAGLETGARYSELARLTAGDCKTIEHTDKNGNRKQVSMIWIARSKTGVPRHIILSDDGAALFTRLCVGRAGKELIFRRSNGEPYGRAHQHHRMIEACRRARIEAHVNFHALRHTWASHAVMNGVDLAVVAKNLGHANTTITQKHYAHLASSFVIDTIQAGAPSYGIPIDKKITRIG